MIAKNTKNSNNTSFIGLTSKKQKYLSPHWDIY
jgi:hypothetical protein